MWNDILFQSDLLEMFDNDEVKAFRWLFTPIRELNHQTPIEVINNGGINRIWGIIRKVIGQDE